MHLAPTKTASRPGSQENQGSGAAVSTHDAMARCIERHRRAHRLVIKFSQKKAAADNWMGAITAAVGLAVCRILARLARRQLISQPPLDAKEADAKVLYLIAATMVGAMDLNPAEITKVRSSVR